MKRISFILRINEYAGGISQTRETVVTRDEDFSINVVGKLYPAELQLVNDFVQDIKDLEKATK